MNTKRKVVGLGTVALGALYTGYLSLTPEKVIGGIVSSTVQTTYEQLGDLSEREKGLCGRIVRPSFPTSGAELSTYWTIMCETKAEKMKMIAGGAIGSTLCAYMGLISTRGIQSTTKRVIARLVIIPSLFGFGGVVASSVTLTVAVYSIRNKFSQILVPVGPSTDAVIRKLLPDMVVNRLVYFPSVKHE